MEKDYNRELEEIDDGLEQELTKEQLELLEIEKEQSTEVRNGQVEFVSVNHSERANKFGRASDGDITEYANIALEYFGHRCALSGERFVSFEEKVNGKKQNLSAEHIVALCLGGDDIVPNIVPTVLQYNLRKNGYYLLDYWDKQKDTEGKSLYSPYRLLKLVNYMMKSIDARGLNVEEYRKSIMTPNEIDRFLEEIEKQDELEPNNSKKRIYSNTITATTLDEDNKKILTEIPSIEGNIPTLGEQQEKHTEIKMMDIFLSDAVGVLKKEQELQQVKLQDKDGSEISLQDKLDGMLEMSINEICFEVEVRNAVLQKLEALGVENNKYSVANDLIRNTEILDLAKENREQVDAIVEAYFENQLTRIRDAQVFSEEQLKTVISNMPTILYNEKEMNKIKLWSEYRSESFEELISGNYTATDEFIDTLIVLKKNGIDFVYKDENGRRVNTIKQTGFTIEAMLENYYPRLLEEKKQKIILELENLGINENIGKSLSRQKQKENIQEFTMKIEKLQAQLKQEGIEISEDEINNLIGRQNSKNQRKDVINVIEILKKNGISLVYKDENGNVLNTIITSSCTIEIMLENYYPKLTENEKEKIKLELKGIGISENKNIGYAFRDQRKKVI